MEFSQQRRSNLPFPVSPSLSVQSTRLASRYSVRPSRLVTSIALPSPFLNSSPRRRFDFSPSPTHCDGRLSSVTSSSSIVMPSPTSDSTPSIPIPPIALFWTTLSLPFVYHVPFPSLSWTRARRSQRDRRDDRGGISFGRITPNGLRWSGFFFISLSFSSSVTPSPPRFALLYFDPFSVFRNLLRFLPSQSLVAPVRWRVYRVEERVGCRRRS